MTKKEVWMELNGFQIMWFLDEWRLKVIPTKRAMAVMANRPPDAEWESFVASLADKLDTELTLVSHMSTVVEMQDRIATWGDDLVIALISRLGHRSAPLRREFADRVMLRVSAEHSFLTMIGGLIRKVVVDSLLPEIP